MWGQHVQNNRTKEVTDHNHKGPQPTNLINRIVLLGASNLTLSRNLITRLIQRRCGYPSEVLVAAGHGRSYGHYSRVMIRGLQGITSCDLWSHLELTNRLPTYAFLTDIGNDLPYGHKPEELLEWISWCVNRLLRQDAHIVMTNIPIALIESLSEWHFMAIRSIFFPFSRLSRVQLVDRAKVVHRGIEEMASQLKFELYEVEPCWLGPDIIHVLYWKRKELYRRIFDRFPASGDPEKQDMNMPANLLAWHQRPRFAYKKVMGWERCYQQPSAQLNDGTTISMY